MGCSKRAIKSEQGQDLVFWDIALILVKLSKVKSEMPVEEAGMPVEEAMTLN